MIRSAAIAIVCEPEEQKRLTVTAGTSCGSPARNEAMRATFAPDSASGVAQPRITSSIVSGGSPGRRFSKSLMTAAAMSSGRVVRNVPLGAFPTAVRTAATMTASFISEPPTGRPLLGPQASSPAGLAKVDSVATSAGEDACGPRRARPLVQSRH